MKTNEKIAIYPGSFDPLTNGHMDIIDRALKLFDRVIVSVMHNPKKSSLFSVEERVDMIRTCFNSKPNLEVDSFDGLLVDYTRIKNAIAIVRGMRAISDFENEFQMALMNRRLNRDVQTIFLMTGLRWIFTSSSIIKEVATFGGDITGMVPQPIKLKVLEKFPLKQGS
ncbi:CoaD [Desulforapulum autotrophicum HRM2]|uniref:Phosphopantetheine adenylyltransferase n=1 Tax=Desulforapulum autotrophicum (strain ATCC 43914 / DSM 3382 / VKM B-1955 / HRM2) TaxID=177437 RepID=C0QLE0_DESAH|nr:pantetheine-phosphate adenylyltransferase [Desulforapulum autotrophicum]ACN14226.1 CoaD [Desulforapulum autotrophicum HRM2]